jgi:hypothetical protein
MLWVRWVWAGGAWDGESSVGLGLRDGRRGRSRVFAESGEKMRGEV